MSPTLDAIRQLLSAANVDFREVSHPPTLTSEDSAKARNEPLHVGAKAILLKTDEVFRLFVLPAHQKVDSAAIKKELGAKKTRFATPDELLEATGLVPGSVPPFGAPILPFELFGDTTIGEQLDRVAFNAGSLTQSIIMTASDWRRVARPREFRFGKEA